jgi:hypothetical protein
MSLGLITTRLSPIIPPIRSIRAISNRCPYPQPRKSPCPQYQALRSWRRQFSTGKQRIIYQNSISWTTTVTIAVAIGASIGFAAGFSRAINEPTSTEPNLEPASPEALISEMTTPIPPGRPGNLTPDQEAKLRELWQLALQVFGVAEGPPPQSQAASPNGKPPPTLSRTSTSAASETPAASSERKKKSRLSFLKKKSRDTDESASDTPTGSMSGTSTPSSGKSRLSSAKDFVYS